MRRLGLIGWVVCACGPGPLGGEDHGATAGGSGETDGVGATGSAGGDERGDDAPAGSDDGVGSDGDATGSADDGTGGPDPIGLCDVPAGDVLAVTMSEAEARLVRGDGSIALLDARPIQAPSGANVTHWAVASADTVAVSIAWSLIDDGISHGFTLRIFDADGAVSWERHEDGASLGALALGDDGSLVASRTLDDGTSQGVLYTGPDAPHSLGAFQPIGALGDNGFIPGRLPQADAPGVLGWFDTEADAFVPTTVEPAHGWYRLRDGALVVQTDTAIVVEHPDEVATIELGPLAETLVSASSDDWLLLRDTEGTQWARVSLATHVVEPVELAPPRTFSFLECYFLSGSMDRTGHVYAPTRDAAVALAQRFDPTSQTWVPIGEPVTRIDNLDVFAAGDTILVHSHAENTTFCPPQSFEPTDGVIEGHSWQVVRPIEGLSWVLPADTGWVAPNTAGTCVHSAGEAGSTVLDVRSGDTLTLEGTVLVLR